ncbi:MAG: hypothetical protein AAF558_08400 [Verrucomicrobiota bacterium]
MNARISASLASRCLPLGVLILVLHLCITFYFPNGLLQDPGIGWHLKSGELILKNQDVAGLEPFAWTVPDHEWIQIEWLFDALIGALYNWGGLALVSAGSSFLFALICVLLLARMLHEGSNPVISIICTLGAYLVLSWHALARPHIFTYLFLISTLWLLHLYRERGGVRYLWPLVPMATLWCNFHGGFVVGLLVLFISAAGLAIDSLWNKDAQAREKIPPIVLFGILVGLATLVNPYGLRLHIQIIEILGMECLQLWNEFKPTTLTSPNIHIFVFEAFIVTLIILACTRGKSVRWEERIILVVFLHYAFQAMRHVNLFIIACAPVLARMMTLILQERFIRVWERGKVLSEQQVRAFPTWITVSIVIGFLWLGLSMVKPSFFGTQLAGSYLSSETADYLKANRSKLGRLYNTNSLGGTLIYFLGPETKIFMDDRADLFEDAFVFETYLPIARAEPGWDQRLDQMEIDSLILRRKDKLAEVATEHPNWKSVYSDELNIVFVRQNVR